MKQPIDLELLRTFVAAEAAPNLTMAAAARRVTKSAVSQQLRALEAQMGVALFERVGRHVRPTETARTLAASLRAAFATVDASVEAARDREGAVRGALRLGAPRPFTRFWLRRPLAELLARYPDLLMNVSFGVPSELERRLLAGELDLAVLARAPESPTLATTPLFVETFQALAAPSYLAAHGTPRSAADLAAHRFVAFDGDLPMHAAWWRAAFGPRAPLAGTIACYVASLDEMQALAVAGAGIVVLPDYVAADSVRAGDLVVLRLGRDDRHARNEISLAWRSGAVENARLRAVREHLVAST